MKTAALIFALALTVVPCSGAMAAGTDENVVADIPSVQEEAAPVQADTVPA